MTARARRIIAEIKTAAPLTGDRGFESRFLQRRVHCEPDFLPVRSAARQLRSRADNQGLANANRADNIALAPPQDPHAVGPRFDEPEMPLNSP